MRSTKTKVNLLSLFIFFLIVFKPKQYSDVPDIYTAIISLLLVEFFFFFFLGFEILAFPCNQFAGQEPGSNEEIKEVACTLFKAEFPIFDKVMVAFFYFFFPVECI